MDERAMAILLRMLELRKERAAMASRRSQQDFLKAQNFSQQVDAYAREYDQIWSRSVVHGDQVAQLQTQAAFTNRLQATAQEQRQEADLLGQESQRALSKAVQESDRAKVVRQWLERQKNLKSSQAARRAERELEDIIQARVR